MLNLPSILRNKYFYTGLAFLVWIIFFDDNNLIYQVNLSSKLQDARDQKSFYLQEISNDSTSLKELMTDKESLEKFAREKYLMKRDNEDIYLIVQEEK